MVYDSINGKVYFVLTILFDFINNNLSLIIIILIISIHINDIGYVSHEIYIKNYRPTNKYLIFLKISFYNYYVQNYFAENKHKKAYFSAATYLIKY
jgi:hypothetical protein